MTGKSVVVTGGANGIGGIRVSCLCPNAVYTGMFGRPFDDEPAAPPVGGPLGEVLMPEEVADTAARRRYWRLPAPFVPVGPGLVHHGLASGRTRHVRGQRQHRRQLAGLVRG
jgi:NAD(P)-dependent dehydrogenase (short-subunit alcohol dehydrogenase family)